MKHVSSVGRGIVTRLLPGEEGELLQRDVDVDVLDEDVGGDAQARIRKIQQVLHTRLDEPVGDVLGGRPGYRDEGHLDAELGDHASRLVDMKTGTPPSMGRHQARLFIQSSHDPQAGPARG